MVREESSETRQGI
jgi:hypothetical protein